MTPRATKTMLQRIQQRRLLLLNGEDLVRRRGKAIFRRQWHRWHRNVKVEQSSYPHLTTDTSLYHPQYGLMHLTKYATMRTHPAHRSTARSTSFYRATSTAVHRNFFAILVSQAAEHHEAQHTFNAQTIDNHHCQPQDRAQHSEHTRLPMRSHYRL